jgi:hypothetical protein
MSRNKRVMPIHVDNIRLETWGMSAEQVGAYLLILMDLWANGPMKYDDKQLALVARTSLKKWLEIGPYVMRFLILENGKVTFENGRHIGHARRSAMPPSLREKTIERDGFVCTYCGTTEGAFEIDHIHPVSRGGENDLDNLCVACAPCNRSKRNLLVSEWTQ